MYSCLVTTDHVADIPTGQWERNFPVTLKSIEFVDDRRPDQALRELTILGVRGKGIEPGYGVTCGPDGCFGGDGNREVGDVESWATAEVQDLHGIETIQRPQQPKINVRPLG